MDRVQVLVEDEGNRRALARLLDSRYTVVESDELVGADLYLVDDRTVPAYRDALVEHKRETHPTFCPVVLIRREDTHVTVELGGPDEGIDEEFQLVDGTVAAPVDRSTLFRRMENLLTRRQQSIELTERYERTQARFEGLFEAIPDPAFVLDGDGTVSAANRAFRELIATEDSESVVGRELSEFPAFEGYEDLTAAIVPGSTAEPPTEPLVVGERRRHLELRHRTASVDGTTASVVVMHDVTDLVEANEQLEDFASIVTHDLRNPMNVAMARLAILRNRVEDDEGVTGHIDVAADALERMNDLIEGVRTLVRETTVSDAETVEVDSLARSAWETVETETGTLVVDEGMTVVADQQRLRQLFENLFRNSVEHSSTGSQTPPDDVVERGATDGRTESDGGENDGETGVTIEVGRTDDDGFYVADDGPGIPADHRTDVFDAGFSTRSSGTGLGLKIVAEIVRAHGWDIDVTESADGGARFEVTGVERPPD